MCRFILVCKVSFQTTDLWFLTKPLYVCPLFLTEGEKNRTGSSIFSLEKIMKSCVINVTFF